MPTTTAKGKEAVNLKEQGGDAWERLRSRKGSRLTYNFNKNYYKKVEILGLNCGYVYQN